MTGRQAGDRNRNAASSVTVVNPLPATLAHYQLEMLSTLGDLGRTAEHPHPSIEGRSVLGKLAVIFGSLFWRLLRTGKGNTLLVVWPVFGYFDALTWWWAARRNTVVLIVHDVTPLRPQFGYSSFAHKAFRFAVRRCRITVVCHTAAAAAELQQLTGVVATLASHPVMASGRSRPQSSSVVRVLGQYKTARDLTVLAHLGAKGAPDAGYTWEIHGRGWPAVDGWTTQEGFIEEAAFDTLVSGSACVVIPYTKFYQSGVIIRCLENLTPVVAVAHPQVDDLFGEDWPGVVRGEDWRAAVERATAVPSADRAAALASARDRARSEWAAVVGPTNSTSVAGAAGRRDAG
ncbi:hypothetical protein D1871_09760 [Nakamurella silvestris]|nr:hypothetical protein D1871_09760 [Nakamurella silvestris]